MNKNITITSTDQPFVLLITLHDEGDRKILVHASTDYGRAFHAHTFGTDADTVRFYQTAGR